MGQTVVMLSFIAVAGLISIALAFLFIWGLGKVVRLLRRR